jgi:hypothetical protein
MRTQQQDWRSWLAPVGPPTAVDWCWLALAAAGMAALAVLLTTFFMIR